MVVGILRIFCLAATVAFSASAEEQGLARFADDAYVAGDAVSVSQPGIDNLFAGGETLRIDSNAAGTAHLLARRIVVTGDLGALYAMGMDVEVTGAVSGDASVLGYRVTLAEIGGTLRASGSEVVLTGPVGGYALIAGDEVRIDGVIAGDLRIAARSLSFGDDARVEGTIHLYEDESGDLSVPESVAPAERIERRDRASFEADHSDWGRPAVGGMIAQFVTAVLIVSVLAAALAAIMPGRMADLRHVVLQQPMRCLWIGTLTQSALVGVTAIAAMTLIGILTIPAFLVAAALLGFIGYVVGVYAFGVSILNRAGRDLPDGFGDRALAAGTGALAAAIIALIPFLGWLFVLALALAGVGAILVVWANPRFFEFQ